MTDKELLELSAKSISLVFPSDDYENWDPLTDSADTFLLLAHLNLNIEWRKCYDENQVYFNVTYGNKYQMECNCKKISAMRNLRRVIVCIAADIGFNMESK